MYVGSAVGPRPVWRASMFPCPLPPPQCALQTPAPLCPPWHVPGHRDLLGFATPNLQATEAEAPGALALDIALALALTP